MIEIKSSKIRKERIRRKLAVGRVDPFIRRLSDGVGFGFYFPKLFYEEKMIS